MIAFIHIVIDIENLINDFKDIPNEFIKGATPTTGRTEVNRTGDFDNFSKSSFLTSGCPLSRISGGHLHHIKIVSQLVNHFKTIKKFSGKNRKCTSLC